jgi:mannan endo-1,6-alpha-mannosidase
LIGLTNQTINTFFAGGPMVEIACELDANIQCTTDMLSFKGYVHRWMAQTTQMAPFLHDTIMPALKISAQGMVNSCNSDGTCGFRWNRNAYDGVTGAGQEMNAMGALMSLLIDEETVTGPVTNSTGGTSIGNPNAGADPDSLKPLGPLTGADRAGAGILTFVVLVGLFTTMVWMSTGMSEGHL